MLHKFICVINVVIHKDVACAASSISGQCAFLSIWHSMAILSYYIISILKEKILSFHLLIKQCRLHLNYIILDTYKDWDF